MSEHDFEPIINAINTVKSSNDTAHELLREFILVGNAAIQKNIEASAWVTNNDIKALTARLDKANGNVARLQEESLKREEVVRDFRKLEADLKRIRAKWMLLLLGGILFVVSVIFVYDMGMFPKLFEWLIGKIVK